MYLSIKDLLPTYFEKGKKETSEIWGKDLKFEPGEMIKIVAPSGSGKTSLMHFLYGLRHEYHGSIQYDNEKIDQLGPEKTANYRKDHVSIVFQDMRLFPDLTVWENINIKRQLNPFHQEEKIAEMARQLGIENKLKTVSRICSYGEQQRTAIIRALMQPFDFLLLDEPFSHLDNQNAERAMQLMMEEAGSRNAAIIFADLERVDFFPFTRIFHL